MRPLCSRGSVRVPVRRLCIVGSLAHARHQWRKLMSAVVKPSAPAKTDEQSGGGPKAIYHVTRVERCKLDQSGQSGYRYVIEGGYAPITGFHTGTKELVSTHASDLAKEMNARRGLKGTKHIVIGKPKG